LKRKKKGSRKKEDAWCLNPESQLKSQRKKTKFIFIDTKYIYQIYMNIKK